MFWSRTRGRSEDARILLSVCMMYVLGYRASLFFLDSGRRFVRLCACFDAHLIPPEGREEAPGAELKDSKLEKMEGSPRSAVGSPVTELRRVLGPDTPQRGVNARSRWGGCIQGARSDGSTRQRPWRCALAPGMPSPTPLALCV